MAPVTASDSAEQINELYAQAKGSAVEGEAFGSPDATGIQVSKLDFGMTPATPATPPFTTRPPFTANDSPASLDYTGFIQDTLMWTNTVRSAIYLVTGVILILLVNTLLFAGTPLLTIVCHLTLAQMALNFIRQWLNPSLQERATWLDSAWTAAAINRLASSVKGLAAVHDEHLSASSPHKHLIIATSLWLLSMFARLIPAPRLVLMVYVAAFIFPKLYSTYKGKINPLAQDTFAKAKKQIDAVDRRGKAIGIAVAILVLGYSMSSLDLALGAFVLCVYVRSQLPGEMDHITKKVGPITTPLGNAAANFGGRIGRMASSAVEKYELTPTPMKKKNL